MSQESSQYSSYQNSSIIQDSKNSFSNDNNSEMSSEDESEINTDLDESYDEFNLVKMKFFYDDSITNITWNEHNFYEFANMKDFYSKVLVVLIFRFGSG